MVAAEPDSTRAWDLSAERYAAFASRSGLYRYSAEAMVARADLQPGHVVVDLACGTGVVSEAILGRPEGERVELFAVDFSEGMLGMARRRVRAGNVHFRRGRAEDLGQLVTRPVDRLFCHAAFWQFDAKAVLGELGRTLAPSGRCFISIPESPFRRIDFRSLHHLNKPIWMAIEEARLRGHPGLRGPWRGPKGRKAPPPPGGDGYFDRRLKDALATGTGEHGLRLSRVDPIVVDVRPEEYVEFLDIPVMASDVPFFRGVSPDELRDIVRVVLNELKWTRTSVPAVAWRIYVLERA
jgi:SAM-dependent methyltransferase